VPRAKPEKARARTGGMGVGVPPQAPTPTPTVGEVVKEVAKRLERLAEILSQREKEALENIQTYGYIGPFVSSKIVDDIGYIESELRRLAAKLRGEGAG